MLMVLRALDEEREDKENVEKILPRKSVVPDISNKR
jgi:hypothetical protein